MATGVHTLTPPRCQRAGEAGYVLIRVVGFGLIWLGMSLFTLTGVALAIASAL